MKDKEAQTSAPKATAKRASTPARKRTPRKAAAPKATTPTVPGKRAAVIERRQKVLAFVIAHPGATLEQIAKGAGTTRPVAYNDLFIISCSGQPRLYSIRPAARNGEWRWTTVAPVIEAVSA